ncbi:hypothetical protein ACLSZP_00990 [Avibacterium avium]|uniref:hypothetical protein n=1 Tax=Avibacterium avium TaxID=751 RepID=UPI0039FD7EC1
MAYSGKRPKEQAKIAAYILYHEFGASQKNIAIVFNTTQSVISNWIKEAEYQRRIGELSHQLNEARQFAIELSKTLDVDSRILLP